MSGKQKGLRRRGLGSAASRKATFKKLTEMSRGNFVEFCHGAYDVSHLPSFLQWPRVTFIFFFFIRRAFTWGKFKKWY